MLSRARRVSELVQRLTAAEDDALRAAESAIRNAAVAIQDLRLLAEKGGTKLARLSHCPVSANDVDQRPATLTCVICGAEFTATRESAKCCSGKCRLTLSRRTQVADVAARVAKAEAALHEASVRCHR